MAVDKYPSLRNKPLETRNENKELQLNHFLGINIKTQENDRELEDNEPNDGKHKNYSPTERQVLRDYKKETERNILLEIGLQIGIY